MYRRYRFSRSRTALLVAASGLGLMACGSTVQSAGTVSGGSLGAPALTGSSNGPVTASGGGAAESTSSGLSPGVSGPASERASQLGSPGSTTPRSAPMRGGSVPVRGGSVQIGFEYLDDTAGTATAVYG